MIALKEIDLPRQLERHKRLIPSSALYEILPERRRARSSDSLESEAHQARDRSTKQPIRGSVDNSFIEQSKQKNSA